MKEWSNQWNPFNSAKVLIHREHLERCKDSKFLPPVTVSVDPSNKCNYDCIWCNAYETMKQNNSLLTRDHLFRLADFLAEWGVKTVCVAGGGEPFMNPSTGAFLKRLKENKVGCAPVTNGYYLDNELIDTITKTSRWVGFSMDAGTEKTYQRVKGIKNGLAFFRVLDKMKKLSKRIEELNSLCEIGYKFLLHPENALDIFEAAKIAKKYGAHDFQIRPVGWDNILKTKGKIDFMRLIEPINQQIEEAMKLETNNFFVYGVRHKFNLNFQRKVNFKHCWASPIAALVFGADGKCNICLDHRGQDKYVLCTHDPDPREVLKYWGSRQHINLLDSIDPNECPRCTISPYNEIVEQVFIEDRMCRDFT
jgi:MoaA/NifB/PqqE/SkfB family radical SAM enzyme